MPKEAAPKKASRWTKKTLPRLLIIIGAESALRTEALAAVKAAAFGEEDPGMSWVLYHGPSNQAEGALTPADVLDEVCTASMFADPGEMKVVAVKQADFFLSTKDPRESFESAAEKIPDTATLVLEAATYGAFKSTKFYKTLAAAGQIIECDPLVGKYGDSPELGEEVDKRARARGLALSHGALAVLLGRSAKNLGVIDTELEKLALELNAKPDKPLNVSEEQIQELTANTGTFSAFGFADAVLERDARKTFETLGGLFERGIVDEKKPGKAVTNESSITMMVLGALTYKLSQLQDVQAAIDGGKREFDAFSEFKLFGQRQESVKRALRKHSGNSLRKCMEALFRAYMDLRLSGATPQEVMEQMAWKMIRS